MSPGSHGITRLVTGHWHPSLSQIKPPKLPRNRICQECVVTCMRYRVPDNCISFNGLRTWKANRRLHCFVQWFSIFALFLSAFGSVVWPDCDSVAKIVATITLLLLAFKICYQPAILCFVEDREASYFGEAGLKMVSFPRLYISETGKF